MKKFKYQIHNLDCANCAREVEEGLERNPALEHVIVNFATSKLSFESDQNFTLAELNQLVQAIEPEAYLTDIDDNSAHATNSAWQRLLLGIILGLVIYFGTWPVIIKISGFVLSYLLLLFDTAKSAGKTLIKNHSINENTLIVISCVGALLIGEVLEGIMVIVLYSVGKILESKAVNNSRQQIADLVDLKQMTVHQKVGQNLVDIAVEQIAPRDILLVKKGEKVPVDSKLLSRTATLDTSPLTGESLPTDGAKDDILLSGSINLGDAIEVEATKTYTESTTYQILELLETATERKAKTETIVTKISRYYTPAILVLAILVGLILPTIFRVTVIESIYRALTFLVVACPCAIAISVPLAYFTALGTASRQGILIKGSNYLDNLTRAKNIIFDKTGTLTDGEFSVTDIEIINPHYTRKQVITILAAGESLSEHPIAKSILKLQPNKINHSDVKDFHETPGRGIEFTFKKQHIKIGNRKACHCQYDATLHLNIDGQHVASIKITDLPKTNAKTALQQLHQLGLTTYMFTGDKDETAQRIGQRLLLDHIKSEMLPQDKFHQYEKVAKQGLSIFVGDGINDAPVLKRADIGISMGGIGAESAVEASDIVIMQDDLLKIPLAIHIAKYTKKIIYENLIFAILVKIIILTLSVFGLANMWWAVFADTGVTLLAILNTLRINHHFR